MPSDPDPETIDGIIERVTVAAYGDEGHVSFLCAFEDEVDYPIPAILAGTPVTLHNVVHDVNPARGLVGTIANDAGQHPIALIELDLEPGYPHRTPTAPAAQATPTSKSWIRSFPNECQTGTPRPEPERIMQKPQPPPSTPTHHRQPRSA